MEAYGDNAQLCWDDAYLRDASQLAANAYGDPRSTAAIDQRTPQEGPHDKQVTSQSSSSNEELRLAIDEDLAPQLQSALQQLPLLCTFQQMQAMQPMKSIGGKTASAKQRELRKICLNTGIFEIDVTDTWTDW